MHQAAPPACLGVADAKPVGLDKILAERSAGAAPLPISATLRLPLSLPGSTTLSASDQLPAKSRIEWRTLALSCPG